MDTMMTESGVDVKVMWLGTTRRFLLPDLNFASLVNELSTRFSGFEQVQYLDDEGDMVLMSSDQELAHAKSLSKGMLKLVLTNKSNPATTSGFGFGRGRREKRGANAEKCIRKWVERKEQDNQEELIQKLLTLHSLGYPRFRHNLKVLHQNGDDLVKTQQVLQTVNGEGKEKDQKRFARGQKRERCPRVDKSERKRAKNGHSATDIEGQQAKGFREMAQDAFLDFSNVYPWPSRLTRIFVDGNNMFYITGKLRQLTLGHKTRVTEKVLSSVAEAFARMIHVRMEVVFDHATSTSAMQLDNGSEFIVSTAHPAFPTSDAKFVDWAKNNPELAGQAVVITSDRALSGELHSLGVSVVKPGIWLHCVAATLTGETTVHYQQWLDVWTERITQELHQK